MPTPAAGAATAAGGCELARTQALARLERRGWGSEPLSRGRPVRCRGSGSGSARHGRGKLTETLSGSPAPAPPRALSPPPAQGTPGLVVRQGRAARGRARSRDYNSRQPPRRSPVPSRAALVCAGSRGLEMRERPLRPGAAGPQVSAAGPGPPPLPWAGAAAGSRPVGVRGSGPPPAPRRGRAGADWKSSCRGGGSGRRARHGPCPGGAPRGESAAGAAAPPCVPRGGGDGTGPHHLRRWCRRGRVAQRGFKPGRDGRLPGRPGRGCGTRGRQELLSLAGVRAGSGAASSGARSSRLASQRDGSAG